MPADKLDRAELRRLAAKPDWSLADMTALGNAVGPLLDALEARSIMTIGRTRVYATDGVDTLRVMDTARRLGIAWSLTAIEHATTEQIIAAMEEIRDAD